MNKVEPELRQGLYDRGWTKEQVDTLWEIMLEFAKYSFNKSHSQSYAIIAFICAMLKKRHPLEFMCAWYNSLEGHHKKLETCHKEMKRLGVKINKADFRSASPVCVIENGALTYGLTLLKHCNRQIAEDLSGLSFRKYSRFIELLIDIKEHTIINSKQLDILIRLGYFSEFGSVPRLLTICKEFTDGKIKYSKTHKDKTKVKRIEALSAYEDTFNNDSLKKFSPMEIILFEREIYGFIHSVFPLVDGHVVGVLEIDMKYTPKVKTIIFRSGEILEFKVRKDKYFGRKDIEAFTANDTIKIKRMSEREKMKKTDDGWQGTGVNEYYLEQCSLVK